MIETNNSQIFIIFLTGPCRHFTIRVVSVLDRSRAAALRPVEECLSPCELRVAVIPKPASPLSQHHGFDTLETAPFHMRPDWSALPLCTARFKPNVVFPTGPVVSMPAHMHQHTHTRSALSLQFLFPLKRSSWHFDVFRFKSLLLS